MALDRTLVGFFETQSRFELIERNRPNRPEHIERPIAFEVFRTDEQADFLDADAELLAERLGLETDPRFKRLLAQRAGPHLIHVNAVNSLRVAREQVRDLIEWNHHGQPHS